MTSKDGCLNCWIHFTGLMKFFMLNSFNYVLVLLALSGYKWFIIVLGRGFLLSVVDTREGQMSRIRSSLFTKKPPLCCNKGDLSLDSDNWVVKNEEYGESVSVHSVHDIIDPTN